MKQIPNIISILRILLVPLFVWYALRQQLFQMVFILALSGITDFLDGFLARRYHWITQFGKVLDPVADKLTQIAVCLILLYLHREYRIFFVLLLSKECVFLLLGGNLLRKGVRIQGANLFGKITTVLFYVVMILILMFPAMDQKTAFILLSILSLSAVLSLCMYIPEYLAYRRQAGDTTHGG